MRELAELGWMCADCLRVVQAGHVVVAPSNQSAYPLTPYNIYETIKNHGTGSIQTYNGRLPLYACTMVNNEPRCAAHLDRMAL